MENIIRKTVQEEVERQLSPSSPSTKKRKRETKMKNLLAKMRKSDKSVIEKMKKFILCGNVLAYVEMKSISLHKERVGTFDTFNYH